jgi:hypothetical protein
VRPETTCRPGDHRLDARSQQTIKFTQVKFSFNHGWLVQAEAPPSALFTPFKTAIMEGGVREADVAFYFVHWLSDLAGAVPTPLQGSEKFVCHFPHFVLSSFIHSFPIVHQLASKSETQVLEDYLHTRWDERSAQEKTTVSSFVAVYVLHKRDRLEPTRKWVLADPRVRSIMIHVNSMMVLAAVVLTWRYII